MNGPSYREINFKILFLKIIVSTVTRMTTSNEITMTETIVATEELDRFLSLENCIVYKLKLINQYNVIYLE